MPRTRLTSAPASFIAGVICASALASIPALADVVPSDRNPAVFDGASPLLTVEPAVFQIGTSIAPASSDCNLYNSVHMELAWNADDTGSGAASYDVAVNWSEVGDVREASHTNATTWTWRAWNADNGSCGGFDDSPNYLWVIARDHRGFTATSPTISDRIDVWNEDGVVPDWIDRQFTEGNLAVTRTGTWSTSRCTCHNHGETAYTTRRGASLTYSVPIDKPGRTLAVVAPKGSARGVMNISIDGGPATSVNTYTAGANVNRVIVWQRTLDAGTHTLRIVNAGTTGHSRIDIDTLVLGPAWGGEVGRYYGESE